MAERMPLTRAVLLDLATIDRGGDIDLGRLRAACPDWTLHDRTAPGETAARLAAADIAVTNKVVLDRAVLAAAPALRLVCIAATGTNNLDLEAARELGVAVTNVTGYATPAVVQHVFAVMLAHATRLMDYDRAARGGAWARSDQFCLLDYPIRELAGRTLGIIGFGALGQGIARAAAAFGMQVRFHDPAVPGSETALALAEAADVLCVACALTETTRGLVDAAMLEALGPRGVLVNVARGPIVREDALIAALEAGGVAGAALGVFEREPLPANHPLARFDTVVLGSHNANNGARAVEAVHAVTLRNLASVLSPAAGRE